MSVELVTATSETKASPDTYRWDASDPDGPTEPTASWAATAPLLKFKDKLVIQV